MFCSDHNPPHFHAIYGDWRAAVSIEPLQILFGSLPARAQALVFEWARMHLDELKENWKRARDHKPLLKIEPLE